MPWLAEGMLDQAGAALARKLKDISAAKAASETSRHANARAAAARVELVLRQVQAHQAACAS